MLKLTTLISFLAATAFADVAEPTESPKLLQPRVTLRDLNSLTESEVVYRMVVPPGASKLIVRTAGGRGDCDVFVRRGVHPTSEQYDEAGTEYGNTELVSIAAPESGVWYVLLHASNPFEGVRLTVDYTLPRHVAALPVFTPGPGTFTGAAKIALRSPLAGAKVTFTTDGSEPTPASTRYRKPLLLAATTTVKARAFLNDGTASPVVSETFVIEPAGTETVLQSGVAAVHRCGSLGSMSIFKINVPAGPPRKLQIETVGGIGASALYVRHGAPPTTRLYDRRINKSRNIASFERKDAAPGDWYIGVRALGGYSGVAVFANHTTAIPDLVVWRDTLQPYITTETFAADECSVVEGHITEGTHRLLRFSTESRNIGGADLVVGSPVGNPNFEFAECHGHYHFLGFARYRLLDSQGGVAAVGRKVSFCLEDIERWNLSASENTKFTCDAQGIQEGWSDIYDSGLEGQWVDITGVPAGEYILEVTMNPDHVLLEGDYTNNVTTLPVTIPAP